VLINLSIQRQLESPVEAVVLFLTLERIDRERGTLEAIRFAREYENNAPDGDFSVYLELLEAERAAFCETGTA
jgi:hypothetical protein